MLRLSGVVPPSDKAPRTVDWGPVESALGHRLPADYKEIVETYGPGTFGNFIYILQPDFPAAGVDLVRRNRGALDALVALVRDWDVQLGADYRLDDPADLLAAAVTDNGDMVFWDKRGSDDPDQWTIAGHTPRVEEWFTYPGGLDAFLTALIADPPLPPLFDPDVEPLDATFDAYDVDGS